MVRPCACGRPANARIIFGPEEHVRRAAILIDCAHCDRAVCPRCSMPDPTGKRAVCGSCGLLYPPMKKDSFAKLGDLPWE